MATIGFVLPGWPGHDNPAVRLAALLEQAGHRVAAWRSRDLGRHVPVLPAGARKLGVASGAGWHYLAGWRLSAAVELTGPLIERLGEAAVDLVVHDSMTPWGGVAAEWLGLPQIVSMTHCPYPVPATLAPAPPAIAERFEADRIRLVETWGIDVADPGAMLDSRGDLTYLYTTPEVSGLPAADESWRFIGPLLPASSAVRRRPTGQASRPLVYVSLGTSFNRDAAVHRTVLAALGDLAVDVLVSTGRGLPEEELRPVPPNATVVTWADPEAVLPVARLLVTHGGATSVHEALVAGIPMLVLPQAADQYHWAGRMEALGVAEALAQPDLTAIRAAAHRLLEDPVPGARAADVGSSLIAHDGGPVAVAGVASLLAG